MGHLDAAHEHDWWADFKRYLISGTTKWRNTNKPPNGVGVKCIEKFSTDVERITYRQNLTELDELLMPFGQALKKKCPDYQTFVKFCE
mgnify:CR=1 FL=1|jgi:hypothetical protein